MKNVDDDKYVNQNYMYGPVLCKCAFLQSAFKLCKSQV